ncbi:MAG: ATP-binding cassette domain-containing protein, partial [Proteobacteria bacterium]|nr:ATP-binding cassette domain-containing protein [Pseudomonadota bacterium]
MPLLTLIDAELAFGAHPLLDRAEFSLEPGERIGLIGRNGTGKSSLLEVIAGRIALDDGEMQKSGGVRIVSVRQEPELPAASTLRES